MANTMMAKSACGAKLATVRREPLCLNGRIAIRLVLANGPVRISSDCHVGRDGEANMLHKGPDPSDRWLRGRDSRSWGLGVRYAKDNRSERKGDC